ncbi:MAG TPA: CHAP domain-containing protein, partial [Polyangiales bacterium]
MPSAQALRDFQADHCDWNGRPLVVDGKLGARTRWAMAIADLPRWRRAIVQVACSQVGVVESPLGSNRGVEVDAYLRPSGLSAVPWCAAFVSWVLREAGVEQPGGYQVSAAQLLRSLRPAVRPLPGDVFGWVNSDGTGHCGFTIGVGDALDVVATVEGNSRHSVRVCSRPRVGLQFGSPEPAEEHHP